MRLTDMLGEDVHEGLVDVLDCQHQFDSEGLVSLLSEVLQFVIKSRLTDRSHAPASTPHLPRGYALNHASGRSTTAASDNADWVVEATNKCRQPTRIRAVSSCLGARYRRASCPTRGAQHARPDQFLSRSTTVSRRRRHVVPCDELSKAVLSTRR